MSSSRTIQRVSRNLDSNHDQIIILRDDDGNTVRVSLLDVAVPL